MVPVRHGRWHPTGEQRDAAKVILYALTNPGSYYSMPGVPKAVVSQLATKLRQEVGSRIRIQSGTNGNPVRVGYIKPKKES